MFYKSNKKRPIRQNRYRLQRIGACNQDDFMAKGDTPAWRSLLRFFVLGVMVIGAIYLSAVSMNILVLGTDDVDYSKHTDTIMLMHWQPLPSRLALLSIPRDTLIRMPKRGPLKINAVYAYGNALGSREYALAMTRASIETLLGVKVNYVIHVRYSNFITLVDALGGVPLYVEKRMRYTDQAGGLNIDLDPGYQLLDGRQALNYVRFRHDRDGDIGRIRRQQKFVKAFINQLVRFSKFPRTASAFYTFLKQVETNLNFPTAIFLAMEIKGAARGSWRQAILPGKGVYIKGKSYWKPDLPGIRKVIADLGKPPLKKIQTKTTTTTAKSETVGKISDSQAKAESKPAVAPKPTVKPKPKPTPKPQLRLLPKGKQPVVRVLNGCGVPGVAGRITKRLMSNNIQILEDNITNAPNFDFAYTIIKCKSNYLPWAKHVAAILELSEDRIQVVPKKINYPTVTIVIGGDYAELIK
ncbi:LCP family protein [bacterium]|nr:LCP family protein [bacterium]